jgi:DNA-binding transcriptional MerR regulator
MNEVQQTTGALAREADVSAPTVRLYADLELIKYTVDSRGNRLFEPGTAAKVREIYAERMGRRGRVAG